MQRRVPFMYLWWVRFFEPKTQPFACKKEKEYPVSPRVSPYFSDGILCLFFTTREVARSHLSLQNPTRSAIKPPGHVTLEQHGQSYGKRTGGRQARAIMSLRSIAIGYHSGGSEQPDDPSQLSVEQWSAALDFIAPLPDNGIGRNEDEQGLDTSNVDFAMWHGRPLDMGHNSAMAPDNSAQGGFARDDSAQGAFVQNDFARDDFAQNNSALDLSMQDDSAQNNSALDLSMQDDSAQNNCAQNKPVQKKRAHFQKKRAHFQKKPVQNGSMHNAFTPHTSMANPSQTVSVMSDPCEFTNGLRAIVAQMQSDLSPERITEVAQNLERNISAVHELFSRHGSWQGVNDFLVKISENLDKGRVHICFLQQSFRFSPGQHGWPVTQMHTSNSRPPTSMCLLCGYLLSKRGNGLENSRIHVTYCYFKDALSKVMTRKHNDSLVAQASPSLFPPSLPMGIFAEDVLPPAPPPAPFLPPLLEEQGGGSSMTNKDIDLGVGKARRHKKAKHQGLEILAEAAMNIDHLDGILGNATNNQGH